ncbi:MAG: hypothetical protein ACRD3W_02895, partial [Terriglobales bacterium]
MTETSPRTELLQADRCENSLPASPVTKPQRAAFITRYRSRGSWFGPWAGAGLLLQFIGVVLFIYWFVDPHFWPGAFWWISF